jgi:hypothetical protein
MIRFVNTLLIEALGALVTFTPIELTQLSTTDFAVLRH